MGQALNPWSGRASPDDDVAVWRRRHDVLVGVYEELVRRDRRDDPTLKPPSARVVPAQLPADVYAFTGRAAELAELDGLIGADRTEIVSDARDRLRAVAIAAVSGTAGVGKTALAVRWAHTVAPRFPGGQLYVDLRGYDAEEPMSAADALAGFLGALGVEGHLIPPGTDERAALYRTLVVDRRMLLVLDNASSVEQVRPLLPGTPSCVVVVTSRDSLAGLVARDGARRVRSRPAAADRCACATSHTGRRTGRHRPRRYSDPG